MTMKYNSALAANMKFELQQVTYAADRAQFATSQWDKDYWFKLAVENFDKIAKEIEVYKHGLYLEEQAAEYAATMEMES